MDGPNNTSDGRHDDNAEEANAYKFPSPFDWNVRDVVTLHELRMRAFVAKVLEKPRWWEKVFDDKVVAKWRKEMKDYDRIATGAPLANVKRKVAKSASGSNEDGEDEDSGDDDGEDDSDSDDEDDDSDDEPDGWPKDPVTDAHFEWIFAFLRYAAGQRDGKTGCQVGQAIMLCQSRLTILWLGLIGGSCPMRLRGGIFGARRAQDVSDATSGSAGVGARR